MKRFLLMLSMISGSVAVLLAVLAYASSASAQNVALQWIVLLTAPLIPVLFGASIQGFVRALGSQARVVATAVVVALVLWVAMLAPSALSHNHGELDSVIPGIFAFVGATCSFGLAALGAYLVESVIGWAEREAGTSRGSA